MGLSTATCKALRLNVNRKDPNAKVWNLTPIIIYIHICIYIHIENIRGKSSPVAYPEAEGKRLRAITVSRQT